MKVLNISVRIVAIRGFSCALVVVSKHAATMAQIHGIAQLREKAERSLLKRPPRSPVLVAKVNNIYEVER